MKRGKFIELDGSDGCGKETQSKLLLGRLKKDGFQCEMISFPRYDTPTGRIVGQCYLGKDVDYYGWSGESGWFPEGASNVDALIASPYYGVDRRRAKPEIEESLDQGKIIISDRYNAANNIHQGSKFDTLKEKINYWNKSDLLEYDYLENRRPDLTMILHMPVKVAMELRRRRGEKTKEKADGHESDGEHLKRAEITSIQLAEHYNFPIIKCAPDGTINSLRKEEDIHEEIYRYVRQIL